MTRHDLSQHHAAGTPLPATDLSASMVTVAANSVATSRVPGRQHRAEAQRSLLSSSTSALPSRDRAIADIGCSSKSP